MIKFFIVFVILLNFQTCFSQEEVSTPLSKIQGSKDIPLELNLLLESLQSSADKIPPNDIQNKILPIILNIDSFARVLTKEDIFLIGKVELYKTILKTNTVNSKAGIDGNTIKLLKEAIKKSNDPFINWFLKALLHDTESLLSNPKYKDYVLEKNSGRIETLDLRKMDKKVQLIFRWTSKINPESEDFQELLKIELFPVMIDSLKNIEESFFLMASESSTTPYPGLIKNPKELKFFKLKEVKEIKKEVKKSKSVEDILSPITDEQKESQPLLPEPSKEDWLNDDNAPTNLKNLPKPSDDADWLQDF